MYVSITGLVLRSRWHVPRFFWHAIPCFKEAVRAPGNLHASAKTIDGVRHTLTAWESREQMQHYVRSRAHVKAMRAFAPIASHESKTYGYDAQSVPGWDEARALYDAHAQPVYGASEAHSKQAKK